MTPILIITGNLILLCLGTLHLYYTLFTNKFSTRDAVTVEKMKADYPVLTKGTTVWNAWIGFNGSHSIGAIFFGIINIYLVVRYQEIVTHDPFFFILNTVVLGFYLWLAVKYWFNAPLVGIALAFGCQVGALIHVI
ncbi:MAG: hypothetical protein RIB47_08400 [Cyclobacteriaceae bacterium]